MHIETLKNCDKTSLAAMWSRGSSLLASKSKAGLPVRVKLLPRISLPMDFSDCTSILASNSLETFDACKLFWPIFNGKSMLLVTLAMNTEIISVSSRKSILIRKFFANLFALLTANEQVVLPGLWGKKLKLKNRSWRYKSSLSFTTFLC